MVLAHRFLPRERTFWQPWPPPAGRPSQSAAASVLGWSVLGGEDTAQGQPWGACLWSPGRRCKLLLETLIREEWFHMVQDRTES